ncbi:MAG: hypothetical protein LC130_22790 [Bryobacterales bacterium]|nr:hypothetical protein [Bryobacterales bacterium]
MHVAFHLLLSLAATLGAQPIDIGSRRELFVDRFLIDKLVNARLDLQQPREMGPVHKFDKPWEGAFSGYSTLIKDGNLYRLYYRGIPTSGSDGRTGEVTCYAESCDGIRWTRPNLGLHEVHGTKQNNVILATPPFTHNFAPFLDTRPGVPASERFKGIGGTGKSGLAAFASADGIRWRKLREEPILPPGPARYDSQNLAFYSEAEGRYVCYFRTFRRIGSQNYRWISRTTSADFLTWAPPEEMSFGDAPPEHLYTNQTSPYFRAPHIRISIAARFFPGRQVIDDAEAKAINVDPKYYKDISDAVLFSTRGGNTYDRTFLEAFIRPGLGLENWVSRTNYPAWNVVQTGPAEMSLYVNKNYGQPTAQLVRYTMRLDGFASVHAGAAGGELVTKPLRFKGSALDLNFATSAGGSVRVELQNANGTPIPGFTLADARELIGDQISRPARWNAGGDVRSLEGKTVRIRFVLKDADLYSFRFQ